MKKTILVSVVLSMISFSGIAQMPQSGLPRFVRWVDNNQFVLNTKRGDDAAPKNYVYNLTTKQYSIAPADVVPTEKMVYLKKGDVFLKENGAETQLTFDVAEEKNPTLSPDGNYVGYTKNNNLYTLSLATKKEVAITNDGATGILNGYASWVYFEEILGRPTRYKSYWWSPDSKQIVFMRMDDTKVPLFPIYSENGQHGYSENTRYPKAGDPNPTVRIGITPVEGGQLTWADFNENEDQYFGMPYWMPDAKTLLIQWMNRGQDNLIVYAVNPSNGSKKEVYNEKQKTWIDLDDQGGRISFLGENKGFILQSDKDGWDQLYLHNNDGTLKNQITTGANWSTAVQFIDEAKNIIYFTSRQQNSVRTDLYRVDFDGKNQMRLTFGDYTHATDLSPNGSYFTTRYSNASTPDRLALVNNKGKLILELGDSKGADFDAYAMAKTEILRIPSEDGLFQLPIRITWPLNFDPAKQYPVMINIYGGPNAGTVRDGWQFNGQTQWWAKEGLIQVAMDHRASGQFGKTGINYMHRNLGNWELKDWITIVKWLRTHGADSTRVGIAGFSYGGYMTCMALTAGAGYFTHGLAGGSVTDWKLYDSHYTERFMDTPAENPQGYSAGAVMTYADKYKGLLRIYHGTMDDNVHMQNSLQLVKKLQDSKKHFEFMLYPGGRHGWGGNQQFHSSNENNAFIYKNLLKKEVPMSMIR